MNKARLVLEPTSERAGILRLGARLSHPDGSSDRLWWELPQSYGESVTSWADPWVIGLLFPIMQGGAPVHIEGKVSPSLLANLELFMRIRAQWAPDKYRPVELSADSEAELPAVQEPGLAVASFSCGVDSCFTLYRHARALAGRRTSKIGAAIVQHGLDVWLDQINSNQIYASLLADATAMLDSLAVPCIPMKTNFQQIRQDWADAWVAQQVAGLYLLAGRYDTALIANEVPYRWLDIHLTSHPSTNLLLGGQGFTIIDDGGDYSRAEKAKVISPWPEAMQHLHVCFGVNVPGRYVNCCECEKCIRTMLSFRVANCAIPDTFKCEPSDAQIRRVRMHMIAKVRRWEQLAHGAESAGMGQTGWAKAIRSVLRKHRWRERRNWLQQPFIPLRDAIRKLTRGTPRSRSEIEQLRIKNNRAKFAQGSLGDDRPT
jgi:hypothetical protein